MYFLPVHAVPKHPDMLTMMKDNPDVAQKMWIESASLQVVHQQHIQ